MRDSLFSLKATEGNSIVDPLDPFLLNHSHHLGIVLVSKLLNGDKCGTWSHSMSIPNNKTRFIGGSIKKSPLTMQNFSFGNMQRHGVIVDSTFIEIGLANNVIYASLAKVWEDLKKRFLQNNATRIFQIEKDIASLQQGSTFNGLCQFMHQPRNRHLLAAARVVQYLKRTPKKAFSFQQRMIWS